MNANHIDKLCPDCKAILEYVKPAPADPETGIFKPWQGGYVCQNCDHREEFEGVEDEQAAQVRRTWGSTVSRMGGGM